MNPTTPTYRTGRIVLLVALALVAALVVPPVAYAAKSVAALEAELDALRTDLGEVGEAYDAAYWRLDETEVRLDALDAQMAETEAQLAKTQEALGERVDRMYRMDPIDYLGVILEASSFQELVTTLDFIKRIGTADAEAIEQSKTLADELARQRAQAEEERTAQAAAFKELAAERERLKGKITAQRAEYDRVKKALDAQRGGPARQVPGVPSKSGMVFPVAGANYYSDTWGASRDGGRRSHKGTDIMAGRGTPCVAVLSGSVSTSSSSKGGNSIYLHADNGWVFYYAHLNGYAVTGGRVQAGQTVGYVGSTGNASANAPHLHFEIHPNGGGAVNPYPYLRAMQ